MAFKIKVITAFVATDADGDEGLIAYRNADHWMPLVCADEARVASMYKLAVKSCQHDKKDLRVIQWREGVDVTEAVKKLYEDQ